MGDAVLKKVAEHLRSNLRASDVVVHCGGDEFLVIMPETSEDAEATRDRLNPGLSVTDETGKTLSFPVTLSIGTAYWHPGDPRPLEEVIAEADRNMYEEKQRKRAGPEAAQ